MKKLAIVALVLFSIFSFAQKKQIILVSSKYDFQKEKNEFNINAMLKAILTSNNYQVYFEDEVLPMEIAQNRCNALKADLIDNSNMLLTKIKLQIKDCQNNLLFETAEVRSKEKSMQSGYMETIKLLSPELKKYKPAIVQKKEAVETQEVVDSPKVFEYKTYLNCSVDKSLGETHDFEIIGTEQNVLLFLRKTKNPTVFIAYKEGATGIFTKTENKGIFEYYLKDKYMVEEFSFSK